MQNRDDLASPKNLAMEAKNNKDLFEDKNTRKMRAGKENKDNKRC